jgi:hypothetical protein
MTAEDFITELFCRIDDVMQDVEKDKRTNFYPSEVVTLAITFAIKGVGNRAFYRWISNNYRPLFPNLPERTRLFRLFKKHRDWANHFMVEPTILGLIDTYGIEFIHPIREGRSPKQIGKKGVSNHRWIVGGKICVLLNKLGLVVGWACDTANVHDSAFHPLIEKVKDQMVVFADSSFHAEGGDPPNLKICKRGEWNNRMMIETILSMLTNVSHFKKMFHRVWGYFKAHLAFAMAAFNILVQWDGLQSDENGVAHLSIAKFSL